MDSVVRPLVTGPLFEALSQHVQYTIITSQRELSVPSLPTVGLHMYHEYTPGTTNYRVHYGPVYRMGN